MGISSDKLKSTVVAGGLAIISFALVFGLLSGHGIIPSGIFSRIGYGVFPVMGLILALIAYSFKRYGAERADQTAGERPERPSRLSVAPVVTALAIGGATTALILVALIVLLFEGSGVFLPALIGIVMVLLCGLAILDFTHIKGIKYAYSDPSETNGLEEAIEYFQMVKAPPMARRPPVRKTNVQKSALPPEKRPASIQRPQIADTLLKGGVQKPRQYGDPIVGIWYSSGGIAKAIFYHDGTFDIMSSQSAGNSTYAGGIYRKDADGGYWIRIELEGSSKAAARRISVDERKFILDGNRIYDAGKEDIQFFKDPQG